MEVQPSSYSLASGSEKALLAEGCLEEEVRSDSKVLFKITPRGRSCLKACKNGTISIKPNSLRRAPEANNVQVNHSSHDAIAAKFIESMAYPIALNSRLNRCIESVSGIVSGFLDDIPEDLPDATDLDRHNFKLLKTIEKFNEACEKHHG